MKLKFDSNLDYQTEAVKAVTDLFDGQSSMMSYFSINGQTGFDYLQFQDGEYKQESQQFGQGVGNRLTISKYDILENLRKVQTYHYQIRFIIIYGQCFHQSKRKCMIN